MLEISLLDWVLVTMAVFMTMALLCILCCMSMKLSDVKMKCYIIETAHSKGIKVDPDKLDFKPVYNSNLVNENCSIVVPEVGIIL